jgi:hypothetical protein
LSDKDKRILKNYWGVKMKMKILLLLIVSLFLISCAEEKKTQALGNVESKTEIIQSVSKVINKDGNTILQRFNPPQGFKRVEVSSKSFSEYIQNFKLKPYGDDVYYYNGKPKHSNAHEAVLDLDTGKKDLQQCADSIIRLKAEYLYKNKKYNDIHFNFVSGFSADYSKWAQGYRININNNSASWYKSASKSTQYSSFIQYLDIVYSYASTLSLEKEMVSVDIEDMRIGDVFIKGGSPGHCVIVVDMVENNEGNKMFMVAQGFMPAQDIHILKNLSLKDLSPWYPLDFDGELVLPHWTFSKNSLKRFKTDS